MSTKEWWVCLQRSGRCVHRSGGCVHTGVTDGIQALKRKPRLSLPKVARLSVACLFALYRSRVLCGGPPKGGEGGNLPLELQENERLKNIEPRMVELIANEVHR